MILMEEFRSRWLIATIGCLLYVAGTGVLFWNEGRAVNHIMSLDETLSDAVSLNHFEEIDNVYEGRIVHLRGPVIVGEPLTAPDYDIQVLAVKLKRRVQMYQWEETSVEQNNIDTFIPMEADTRSYYYTSQWRDKLIDSRSFYIRNGHNNPDHFPIESETQIVDAAYICGYELGQQLKEKFSNYVEVTSDTRPEDSSIKLHQGFYYHSNDVFNPQIGDIRILFTVAGQEGEMYTVVGKVEGKKIVPYETSRRCKILLLYPGELNLTELFKREYYSERLTTWSFRFMGWALLFFAVNFTSSLLHILLSEIEFIYAMAPDPRFQMGKVLLSLSLALVIASVAWALHRPYIAMALIFAAFSPFLWCARIADYHRIFP